MQCFYECITCIIRQTVEIAGRVAENQKQKEKIVKAALKKLSRIDINKISPPEATQAVHKEIQRITGIEDLYKKPKLENNKEALALYPYLKRLVKKSRDPLFTAIRLAIAGNIIDYGALAHFDVKSTIKDVIKKKFAVNDYKIFKQRLKRPGFILYIGDNAGEIVFDKVLIEELREQKKVIFAVKSRPVLNDVLMADAKTVGLTRVAQVIESGSDNAGTVVKNCNKKFRQLFKKAAIVIAKGQGSFETLDREKREIFFLLKMKCPYLAQAAGFAPGDIILWMKKQRKY